MTQDHRLPVSTTVHNDMWTTIFSKDFDSCLSCKTSSKWNTNGQSLSGVGCSGGAHFEVEGSFITGVTAAANNHIDPSAWQSAL